MKMIEYPKIGQFRQMVKQVNEDFKDLEKPKIIFKGTVKLHGTNAAVCYSEVDGLYAQSRKNVITPEKDNAGFAKFVDENKLDFLELFIGFVEHFKNDNDTITIFGEWCGGNIQKKVAIKQLDKMFVIFNVLVTPELGNPYFLSEMGLISHNKNIHNINDFKVYSMEIDFNNPALSINKLRDITENVEKQCPVASQFGKEGIGEGVVWSYIHEGNLYNFKVKGDEHSNRKVTKLAGVDEEVLNSSLEFVDYALTENRLNQAIEQVFTINSQEPSVKKTGDFIRWICNDILSEEADTLKANNLEFKNVNGIIAKRAGMWFRNYLDKELI